MLFWQVYGRDGEEHLLNLDHVSDIIFPRDMREAADAGKPYEGNESVLVRLSSGTYIELEHNSQRRELVNHLTLDASRVERMAIRESKKSPERRMEKEARAFWAEFPGHLMGSSERELHVHIKPEVARWARNLERKVVRSYGRAKRVIGAVKRGME